MTNKEMTTTKATEPTRQMITPPVDVLENDAEYLLIADLPGAKTDDVHVEWHNGELTIRAPISFGAGIDLVSGANAGYEYGRRFHIPAGIAGDRIAAELTNGVLKLHVPKEEAKKPRQIRVSAA